jgi:hypothetical protein
LCFIGKLVLGSNNVSDHDFLGSPDVEVDLYRNPNDAIPMLDLLDPKLVVEKP